MLNDVSVMGRLTKDPELRYTRSQIPVTEFTLAVERDYTNEDNSRQADFIDCVAWKGTAELINKYFTKGTKAIVTGRITTENYTDKEERKRKKTYVTVEYIYFAESKKTESGSTAAGADIPSADYSTLTDADDEQLPF